MPLLSTLSDVRNITGCKYVNLVNAGYQSTLKIMGFEPQTLTELENLSRDMAKISLSEGKNFTPAHELNVLK